MSRHSETVIMLDGTEIRREVHKQDGTLWIALHGSIYIVTKAGKYELDNNEKPYYRVLRKAELR